MNTLTFLAQVDPPLVELNKTRKWRMSEWERSLSLSEGEISRERERGWREKRESGERRKKEGEERRKNSTKGERFKDLIHHRRVLGHGRETLSLLKR